MNTPCEEGCRPGPASTVTAILDHRQVAEATFRVRLACPEIAAKAVPGQFVMAKLFGRDDPLLARPLAVYDTFSE